MPILYMYVACTKIFKMSFKEVGVDSRVQTMTPQVGFLKLQSVKNLDALSCQKDHKYLTVKMWPTRACSAHGHL